MNDLPDVVVLSATRTAIGRYGGGLAGVPPCDLAAAVVREAVSRAGVEPADVGHAVFGHDGNGSLLLQVLEDGAAAPDLAYCQCDVSGCDGIDVSRILARFLALELGSRHRGLDACQQSGQIPEHHIVNGALDRAAGSMTQDQDHFRARSRAAKLHAAEHVVIHDIAGDSSDERVADSSIENDLRRHSRIQASQDHRRRVLSFGAGFLLCQVIAGNHLPRPEPLIARSSIPRSPAMASCYPVLL